MNLFSKPLIFAAVCWIICVVNSASAQVVWTNASAATGWLDPLNWDVNLAPTNGTEDAQFGAAPTGATGVGITMDAVGGLLSVGAIEVTSARSGANLIVGNNSTTTSGVLQLNGATVNGVSNTILRNAGINTTILVITNGLGAGPLFAMTLSNAASGGVIDAVSNVVIYSVITGAGFAKTGAGMLTLTASNLYSGNTTLSNGVIQLTDNAFINNSTFVLAGGFFERAVQNITPTRANAYRSPTLVTGNSTIRTTASTTRTVHFDAPFSGLAGTTLMVTNTISTSGTNHFKLYAGGINYAGIIILGASGTASHDTRMFPEASRLSLVPPTDSMLGEADG